MEFRSIVQSCVRSPPVQQVRYIIKLTSAVPRDFTLTEETALEEERSRRLSRQESNLSRRMSGGDPDIFRTHSRRTSLDTRRSTTGIPTIFEDANQTQSPEAEAGPIGAGSGAGAGAGPRPTTPPQQMRSSFNTGLPRTNTTTSSPRSLSFSLPTRPSVERSPIATKASLPSGALTPVKEMSLSRNPSRVDEGEPKTA